MKENNWKHILTMACLILTLLLLLIASYFLYQAPSLGASIRWDDKQNSWVVIRTGAESRLQSGDILRSINGVASVTELGYPAENQSPGNREFLARLQENRLLFSILDRPRIVIRLERAGQTQQITLELRKTGFTFLKSYSVILPLILSLSFFFIGLVVWLRINMTAQGLLFYLMTTNYALLLLTLGFSSAETLAVAPSFGDFLQIANYCLFFLSGALALHFSLLFPIQRRFLDRFPFLIWVYYTFNLLILSFFNAARIDRLVSFYYILTFLSFGYALFAYRKPVEHQQMKWVALGFLFSIGPWLAINGLPLLFTGHYLLPDFIPGVFFLSIPLSIGFAIHKYRLFDIDALFEGTFVYGLTIALLGIIDFGFLSAIGIQLESQPWIGPLGKGLLSIVLVALLYAPLRYEVRRLIKKLFRRDFPVEGLIIRSFLQKASGQSPAIIVQVFAETVRAFLPTKVWHLMNKEDAEACALLQLFSGQNEPVKLWEGNWPAIAPLNDMFVALPLHRRDIVEYVLLLGEPANGRFFSRNDLMVLKSLLMQTELLLENAHLYQENLRQANALVIEEIRNARERDRILKDLHDGLGGITTNIHLLAEMGKKLDSEADIQNTFTTISELSADSLAEIRSFLHSMDETKISWNNLAADLRHFGNRMLEPHDIAFTMECALFDGEQNTDRFLSLIVFRIYKESLANIIKHARAHFVRVFFSLQPDKLFFSVQDDGIGIPEISGKGRGLQNMKKRAHEIGGDLSIYSEQGTRIELVVYLPIKYPEDALGINRSLV